MPEGIGDGDGLEQLILLVLGLEEGLGLLVGYLGGVEFPLLP